MAALHRRLYGIGLSALVGAGVIVAGTGQTTHAERIDKYPAVCVSPTAAKDTEKGLCIRYRPGGETGGVLDLWHDFQQVPLDPNYRIQVGISQPGTAEWFAELAGTSKPVQGSTQRLYNFKKTVPVGTNFAEKQQVCGVEWYRTGNGEAKQFGKVCYTFGPDAPARAAAPTSAATPTSTTPSSQASSAPPSSSAKPTTQPAAVTGAPPAKEGERKDSGPNTLISSCSNKRPAKDNDKAPRDFDNPRVTDLKQDGRTVGKLQVFYSKVNGGTNCAQVVRLTELDKPLMVSVRMALSKDGIGSERAVFDVGPYMERAGGVHISGTKGECVDVSGYIWGGNTNARADLTGVYCG